jgi:CheY-like chemotaxis protein
VAEFEVIDTGPGIRPDDLERIFAPFERGALGAAQPQTGTGLGLTISRLLAGVMGGDIKVESKVGAGSTFKVKILLSEVTNPTRHAPVKAPVSGYLGPRRTILITDDDPVHRDLLREVLTPLGFILLSAPDGSACLALAQHCQPDLFILDISMPGMDGWTVAEALRDSGHHQARILMTSASALEAHGRPLAQPFHDGYLMKPIDIPRLLEAIRQLLKLEWSYQSDHPVAQPRWRPETGSRPPPNYIEELMGLGQIGYIRAIQLKLDEIGNVHPEHADFVAQMRTLIDRFELDQYMATLKTLHAYEH